MHKAALALSLRIGDAVWLVVVVEFAVVVAAAVTLPATSAWRDATPRADAVDRVAAGMPCRRRAALQPTTARSPPRRRGLEQACRRTRRSGAAISLLMRPVL